MNKLQLPGRCYIVGGAVRDRLLGRSVGDYDYVVVGATPEQMIALGFKPVGNDFPVFLHPQTKEEYALARTERKFGRGYHGFTFCAEPTVTLKDDLHRRDLTINAMAMDESGQLIDEWGGQRDLATRLLRHVSSAFIEDPVRVLRIARFAAMLPDFTVADETMQLMREMVNNGEVNHLQAERVWQELSRGLTAARPSRMIQVLADCGALALILPEVANLQGVPERLDYHPEGDSFIHTLMVIDTMAARGGNVAECFAALLHDIGKAQTPADILPKHYGHEKNSAVLAQGIGDRLPLPRDVAQLAVIVAAEHGHVHKVMEMRPATVIDLLMRLDIFRRPSRFESIVRVCESDFYYLPERQQQFYQQGIFIRAAAAAASAVAVGDIAEHVRQKKGASDSAKIAEAIRTARIKAIKDHCISV